MVREGEVVNVNFGLSFTTRLKRLPMWGIETLTTIRVAPFATTRFPVFVVINVVPLVMTEGLVILMCRCAV